MTTAKTGIKYTPKEVEAMNSTYRKTNHTLCLRWVLENLKPPLYILDYGAGKDAPQSKILAARGFKVDPWDIGNNHHSKIHTPSLKPRGYNLAIVSNVANVQPSQSHLEAVIDEVRELAPKVLVNYPSRPRYVGIPTSQFRSILEENFESVERVERRLYLCGVDMK